MASKNPQSHTWAKLPYGGSAAVAPAETEIPVSGRLCTAQRAMPRAQDDSARRAGRQSMAKSGSLLAHCQPKPREDPW